MGRLKGTIALLVDGRVVVLKATRAGNVLGRRVSRVRANVAFGVVSVRFPLRAVAASISLALAFWNSLASS